MNLFKRKKGSEAVSREREPQTHDYGPGRRYWGHDYAFTPQKDYQIGRAMGWGYGLRKDDFILLDDHHGGRGRYKIEKIEYLGDPADMWSANLIFCPRMMTQEERDAEAVHGGGNSDVEKSELIQ